MKKKELKRLAAQIAKYEFIIQNEDSNPSEVYNAKEAVMQISNKITSLEDIMILDELILENLKKFKDTSS